MKLKKIQKKKSLDLKKVTTLVTKKIKIDKIKINPSNIIEDTKNKIGNFYTSLKKERKKEKKKLQKKKRNK